MANPSIAAGQAFFPRARAAFFDLDGTILKGDTDLAWAAFWGARGNSGLLGLFALARLSVAYRGGTIEASRYGRFQQRRAAACGKSYGAMAESFFAEKGRRMIRPSMASLVARYREAGVPAIILTAQDRVIAEPFARSLCCDRLIANAAVEVQLQGEAFCLGSGKTRAAEVVARELGFGLDDSAYFGDSILDSHLLERVGFPAVVGPDLRLMRLAADRGWPIMQA
jgi:Phosphoserine phosphatase